MSLDYIPDPELEQQEEQMAKRKRAGKILLTIGVIILGSIAILFVLALNGKI